MTRLIWANASMYLFGLLRAEIFGGGNYECLQGAKFFVILLVAKFFWLPDGCNL